MCALCSVTSVPVCNLAGGCSAQTLDFLKVIMISGGAGLGTFITLIKGNLRAKKDAEK